MSEYEDKSNSITWIQRFCANILKAGHIPKHVAFIMDGNRRYAKKANVKTIEGHTKGSDQLYNILFWCKEFGIKEITVYAFSIDNFKRTKEEVAGLMKLFKKKLEDILADSERIMRDGICFRFIGNLTSLSSELRKLIAKITLMTEHNDKHFWNIAMCYTSREEITNSIKCAMDGVAKGLINVNDIDEHLLSQCMYTNKSPDPDILVRTSGEKRLSDFLLWQTSTTQLMFTDGLWPEFSFWQLFAAVFKYQSDYDKLSSVKEAKNQNRNLDNPRVNKFVEELNKARRTQLENWLNEKVC